MEGWPWFSSRKPNNAHNIIYHLEKNNILKHIITQNVDQLHQKAGNKNVIELHGNSYGVSCIQCKYFITRQHMQDLLIQLNPNWKNNFLTSLSSVSSTRPDGDIELGKNIDYNNFKIPNCEKCKSGILKPTVTFFGENVSSSVVDYTMNIVKKSDGLLVVGSSLEVYSAFRFVLAAKNNNIPIIIINIGNTRADNLATIKIEAKCGEILPIIYSKLFYNIP
jgi:NAD-dependent deacetylase sirtuin 4